MQELHLRTKIVFGENGIENLIQELKKKKVNSLLLVFAGGGLLKTPLFENIQKAFKDNNIEFKMYTGVNPNPLNKEVNEAVAIGMEFKPQMVISVGGGSNHDASKIIAMALSNNWKDCTDYVLGKVAPKVDPLPLATVATAVGTGSENNNISVITIDEDHFKATTAHPTSFPEFSIFDPTLTYSVSPWQTAAGGFDIFAHLAENYFVQKDFDFTHNIIVALMKTAIKSTRESMKNPKDFAARANMMMSAAYGLNTITEFQHTDGSWNTHWFGHAISGLWNATHGAALALTLPVYLEWCSKNVKGYGDKVALLGQEVFEVSTVEETIKEIKALIKELGLPQKYSDLQEVKEVTEENIDWLVKHFIKDKGEVSGSWEQIKEKDVREIFNMIER